MWQAELEEIALLAGVMVAQHLAVVGEETDQGIGRIGADSTASGWAELPVNVLTLPVVTGLGQPPTEIAEVVGEHLAGVGRQVRVHVIEGQLPARGSAAVGGRTCG